MVAKGNIAVPTVTPAETKAGTSPSESSILKSCRLAILVELGGDL